MKQTSWACYKCRARGVVEHGDKATRLTFIPLLTEAHRQLSPTCRLDLSQVSVPLSAMPLIGYQTNGAPLPEHDCAEWVE